MGSGPPIVIGYDDSVCASPGWWLTPSPFRDWVVDRYYPGATYDLRMSGPWGAPATQCTYDSAGDLITTGVGVGTVDDINSWPPIIGGHRGADVDPVDNIIYLEGGSLKDGCWFRLYSSMRPLKNGNNCKQNSGASD